MTAERVPPVTGNTASVHRPRWAKMLPVGILLLAIVAQMTLMATVHIDRQTGSGFAMFSSVDFAGSRSVVVTAEFDGKPVLVALPSTVDDDVDRLLYAPTAAKARDLAAELVTTTWAEQDGRLVVGDQGPIANVTVTVRALTADGHQLGSHIIAEGSAR